MGKGKNAKAHKQQPKKAGKPLKPAKHSGNVFGAVKISGDAEEELRRILEGVTLEEESYEVGLRMTVDRAVKKYRDMYAQLLDHGFSQTQIESAMGALPQGCTAFDVAMDWLMLNIPSEQLPKKFTSTTNSKGPVQIISKAPAPSAKVLIPSADDQEHVDEHHWDESSPTGEPEAHPAESLPKEKEVKEKQEETNQDKSNQRAWIMQYMEEKSSSEDDSDGLLDYGSWIDPQVAAQQKEEKKRKNLPTESRQKLVAEELTKYKAMASEAKLTKNKSAQKEAGAKIGKLKQEMVELGMTDAMVEALVNPPASNPIDQDSKADQPSPKSDENREKDDADMGDDFFMPFDDLDGEDNTVPEGPSTSAGELNINEATLQDDGSDLDDLGMGLFTGDCAWEEPKIAEKPKHQSSGVVPWGMKRISRKEKFGPLVKPTQQAAVQNWPKALLSRHCQQLGWGQPSYEKLPDAVEGLRYTVHVEVRSVDRRDQIPSCKRSFQVSSFQDGWATVQEAQNAAATVALVHLFPKQQFQHSLPSQFRELYVEVKKELEASAASKENIGEDWMGFVELLAKEKCGTGAVKVANVGREDTAEQATSSSISETSDVPVLVKDNRLDGDLKRRMLDFNASKSGLKWNAQRSQLPVAQIKEKLTQELRRVDAVVLCGDTGCGKTTQVPQYVFEDYVMRGEGSSCSILCTQPRRLAAVSVSDRVAEEMGQSPPGSKGSLLGYHVRLDPAISQSTRITFCTTGILLRRLTGDRLLHGVSHVIVDEVHERTMQGDFLLAVLRDLIRLRASMGYPLKVVLMSATLEQALFSEYFNCGVLTTEGRTYPVEHLFLEDAYSLTGYNLDPESPAALKSYGRADLKAQHQRKAGSKEKSSLLGSGWGDTTGEEHNTFEVLNPYYDPEEYQEWNLVVRRNLARVNEDRIDYELLEQLVLHINAEFQDGCILVFLPGMGEINQLFGMLSPRKEFDVNWLIRLHSSLTPEEQKRAFSIPPQGTRKVVISTNIAETSLTIPDVVFVVDSGKLKERRFDPGRGIAMLVEDWVAKASAKQRKGRAGRVQAGHCFSLFTRSRYNSHMKPYQKPEIMRMPLEEIILQVHSLKLGNSMEVMERLVQPPESIAVRKSLENLVTIGAIKVDDDRKEVLTPLGEHLAQLPVDARIGKLLVWAACFGCLSPALTIAAALSGRSIFVTGPDQSQANAIRKKIAAPGTNMIASGQQSDLLVVVAAYDGWRSAHAKGGWKASKQFATERSLHVPTLEAIKDLRLQFMRVLAEGQLVQGKGYKGVDASWVDSEKCPWNMHYKNAAVVKALLCAALYPNIAVMQDTRQGPARWMDSKGEVEIHSSSINQELKAKDVQHPYIAFLEKVKTHKLMLRDCTVISPLSLLLFGGAIKVKHGNAEVSIDDWITIKAVGDIAVLMKKMRKALDDLMYQKLKQPGKDFSEFDSEVLSALVSLLGNEAHSAKM